MARFFSHSFAIGPDFSPHKLFAMSKAKAIPKIPAAPKDKILNQGDKGAGNQPEGGIDAELEKMNYPSEEDIMNPENGSVKVPHAVSNRENPGDNLDIPGAELDDDMEDIGEEDEENNYYSLGGDKKD